MLQYNKCLLLSHGRYQVNNINIKLNVAAVNGLSTRAQKHQHHHMSKMIIIIRTFYVMQI